MSCGVFWLEFDGALKRLDGFSRPPHFHQRASQSRPAPLIGGIVLEQLAETGRLANEDVWVAVRQLGKVTEVPSARPAKCWIVYPADKSFWMAAWSCLAIWSKEIRILSDLVK